MKAPRASWRKADIPFTNRAELSTEKRFAIIVPNLRLAELKKEKYYKNDRNLKYKFTLGYT